MKSENDVLYQAHWIKSDVLDEKRERCTVPCTLDQSDVLDEKRERCTVPGTLDQKRRFG
jgi:hypothetical protein